MTDTAPSTEFTERRDTIRRDMGGADKLRRLHEDGLLSARSWIDRFCDESTFVEFGTFAASENLADRPSTPGDGVIGGFALRDGRRVGVIADDLTVKRASSSVIGQQKMRRIIDSSIVNGHPFVYFAGRGGARIPDTLGSEGFAKVGGGEGEMGRRRRRVPIASVIVSDSFGGSTLTALNGDVVVQLKGTTMAMTSPRVIEVATGETITNEELGGADVHRRVTGMVDHVAETPEEAIDWINQFLDLMPDNGWTTETSSAGVGGDVASFRSDVAESLRSIVPTERRKVYDMRAVVDHLRDPGPFVELKAGIGVGLMTALTRIGGRTVGIMASQPKKQGGALTPASCDKAVNLLCLCDAYNIPVVSLIDTPGFLVGSKVEHEGLVPKAVMFQQALALAEIPIVTVVIRKAFGLAFFSLAGSPAAADAVLAWPGAEIGFMDPVVGASVLYRGDYEHLDVAERREELFRKAEELAAATDAFGPAAIMKVDEIIDPDETRHAVMRLLDHLATRRLGPGIDRPLASWPTIW